MALDTVKLITPLPQGFTSGYIGFGTGGFYSARFDNFTISSGKCVLGRGREPHVTIVLSSQRSDCGLYL